MKSEFREAGWPMIMERFSHVLRFREALLGIVILVIGLLMTFVSPYFLTIANIRALLITTTLEGIISVGMVMVLATGGLDLSVGSTLAFAGVVAGIAMKAGVPMVLSVVFALLAAGGVGLVNGLAVAKLRFDPFITTLATMIMVRGFLLVISNGRAILDLPERFNHIFGQGTLWGFQLPVYYFLAIAMIGEFLLRKVRFFRLAYYVGSNEEAARMSGINVDLVKIAGYTIVGMLAGFSGVLMAARMGTASVTIGGSTNLNVLAACVIGGASFSGGQGTVLGAVLGAFLLQLLINALNIAGVGIYWQQVFTGAVLLGAIAFDKLRRR